MFKRLLRRLRGRRPIAGIVIAAATFFAISAIGGVIGNAVYDAVIKLWTNVIKPVLNRLLPHILVTSSEIPWVLSLVLFIVIILIVYWLLNRIRVLTNALKITTDVVALDDSVLKLLPSLTPANDLRDQMKKVMEELLSDAIKTLPIDFYRAAIYLPHAEEEKLYIRVHIGMTEANIRTSVFYIGDNRSKDRERGVAGHTYYDGQLRVGHIRKQGDRWQSDRSEHISFDQNNNHPSYFSYICIPIVGSSSIDGERFTNAGCLGVICFDSTNEMVFDSPVIQQILQTFGKRTASALSIYMKLQESRNGVA